MDILKILDSDPDYSHLGLSDSELTITLSREEKETVLNAYD
jgi:hypothetical protein